MKKSTMISLLSGLCLIVSVGLSAQEYEGFSYIETEHTRILFEPHLLAQAVEIASFADDDFASVTELIGYAPSERVPVVITDRTAWANGYYSPLPHRIVLFVTSPANRFLGSRTENWLRTLYVHELVHYVHLTMPVGVFGLLSHVLGPDVRAMNAGWMPLWWIEGIAVYAESRLTAGGRGDSAQFELSYKAPILQEQMWHRHQLRYASVYSPPDRAYIGGYLMVAYLIDTYGSEIFADVNRWFIRFPSFGIGFAICMATGQSYSRLYSAMVEHYEASWAGTHMRDALGISVMESATGHYFPPQATERGWIGYTRSARDSGSLVLYSLTIPLQVRDSIEVGRLSDDSSWAVSGDGKTALVAAAHADNLHPAGINNSSQGYSELYRVDLVSGDRQRITDRARLYHPSLNHDGTSAVAIEIAADTYRLVTVDMESGSVERVYAAERGSVYQPQLSAAGDFAVLVEVVEGNSALISVDIADGSVEYLIPHSSAAIYNPRLNNGITFSSDADGSLALYRWHEAEIFRVIDDPVGVMGGEFVHDETRDQYGLLYGVYRVDGYSLRYVAHSGYLPAKVEWSAVDVRADSTLQVSPLEYAVMDYRDTPRPGFWFPYPRIDILDETTLELGISPAMYWLMASTLGRNTIQGTVDYYRPDNQISAFIDYRHQRNWGWVGTWAESRYLRAGEDWGRRNGIGITVHRLLYESAFLNYRYSMSGQIALDYQQAIGLDIVSSVDADLQLKYTASQQAPRAAFFGGNSLNATARITGGVLLDEQPAITYTPRLSAAVQGTVSSLYPVVRLESDVAYRWGGNLNDVLMPRGKPSWQEYDLPLKLRLTSLLRLPLGNFDRWVPFGGLTAAGMSLFVQSAFYADPHANTGLLWEDRLYAGAEIAIDLVLFAGISVRPVLGVNTRIDPSRGAAPAGREDVHLYVDLIL